MGKNAKGGEACPPRPQNALLAIPSNNSSRLLPAFLKESKPSYIVELPKYDRSIDYVHYAKKGLRNITKKHYQDFLKSDEGKRFFIYLRKNNSKSELNVMDYLSTLFNTYKDNYGKITNEELSNLKYFLNTPGGIAWIFDELTALSKKRDDELSYKMSNDFYIQKFIDLLKCGNFDNQTKSVVDQLIISPPHLEALLITIPESLLILNNMYKQLGKTNEQFCIIFKYIFKSKKFMEKVLNNPELLNLLLGLSLENIKVFLEFITRNDNLPTTPFTDPVVINNMCAFFKLYFSKITFPINQPQMQLFGRYPDELAAPPNIQRQKEYINNIINRLDRVLNNCIPMVQLGGKRKKLYKY